MNRYFMILFLFVTSIILPGCTSDVVQKPIYDGKAITIGIIGTPPFVREENVSFEEITFSQLEEVSSSSDYDAIFITKENLPKAADATYAKIYKTAGVPFFFIETKKSYLPFIDEERAYDYFPDMNKDMYVVGYFEKGEKFQSWGYGLYNDELNDSNIKDVYTRIFETINQLKTEMN